MSGGVLDGWRVTAVRERVRVAVDDEQLSTLNRLASRLLGAPVSLISLIDEDRQVFVGRHGLPEDWGLAGQTPLSHSICKHVVTTDEPVVIEDVRTHPLGEDTLAERDLDVIAYAGVPLRTPTGETLGSFCVSDAQPRRWSDDDLHTLRELADLARDRLELQHLRAAHAGRDRLTGLLTREVFEELVERSLSTARRTTVLAFGLDGFRLVNEALGHGKGDELLIAVAERLSGLVRSADAVCRLAGDVYLVLSDTAEDEAGALRAADRLRRQLAASPYDLRGHTQHVTVSAGAAITSQHVSGADLIDRAYEGLRRAKDRLDQPVRLAGDDLSGPARSRLTLRSAITGAQDRGEIHLVYQPVVDLQTGEVRALEALMRWTHPVLGPVSPADFIPAAELSGAIVGLGEWALRQACADIARWRRLPGRAALAVGVNAAPVQLSVPTFPDVVGAALAAEGLPAGALGIEITERTLLADGDAHQRALRRLHDMGILLSIDDFGTGYSALSYLARTPAQVLKIDRSFVSAIDADERSRDIVAGILQLASGLRMHTVAEGVETAAQHEALRAAGFDWAQGYHYARPAPAADIDALLGDGDRDRAAAS